MGRATPSDEALGELAHQLSLLIRADLELAAAEKLPALRRGAVDAALLVVAAAAALAAVATGTWSAVRALSLVASGWRAPLIVSAGWLLVALVATWLVARALRARTPGSEAGLAALLHDHHHRQVIATQRARRDRAEEDVRRTAEALIAGAAPEVVAQIAEELRARISGELGELAGESDELIDEVVAALKAPSRISKALLAKLLGDAND